MATVPDVHYPDPRDDTAVMHLDSPILMRSATPNLFSTVTEPTGTWEVLVDGVPVSGDLEIYDADQRRASATMGPVG